MSTEQEAQARQAATAQEQTNFPSRADWRVKLALAPDANYLYKARDAGILSPLKVTEGVIFPYTPEIMVTYSAAYDSLSLTHNNYKVNNYTGSSVDNITIGCDFTAQDAPEANYLLAVIHFFKSATKMFYGQDANRGVPPPLVYMTGLGAFQFDSHPLAITSFEYTLPTDVDYIKTTTPDITFVTATGEQRSPDNRNIFRQVFDRIFTGSQNRLDTVGLREGGKRPRATFPTSDPNVTTYVPTKIRLMITCIPMMSRNVISNKFSLKDYATGSLLQGSKSPHGGIW